MPAHSIISADDIIAAGEMLPAHPLRPTMTLATDIDGVKALERGCHQSSQLNTLTRYWLACAAAPRPARKAAKRRLYRTA